MKTNTNELQNHYSKKQIAIQYMNRRLGYPIGKYRHIVQVNAIENVIKKYAIKKVIEIAPGPGRLTKEIKVEKGLAIDSSPEMLELAKQCIDQSCWKLKLGNALDFSVDEEYEMAMSFRFVWHLDKEKRIKLYSNIASALKGNGIWMFDALFKRPMYLGSLLKRKEKVPEYFYNNMNELIDELKEVGFEIIDEFSYLNHSNLQHIINRVKPILGLDTAIKIISKLDLIKPKFASESVIICQLKK